MSNVGNKNRTPSRCREWERQRRLKFNDAIAKLGDLVKSINKESGDGREEKPGNAQFPKIEIIQKAIFCLKNFTEERSKLKAEVLALEVKLQGIEKQSRDTTEKCNKKDVCVQVTIGAVKGKQNSKYLKLLMLKKSKNNEYKEKNKGKPKVTEKDSTKIRKSISQLPKLLPLTNNVKKENTIVMLPATPYIFPQRPILFPTATPTIVLLDTNLQALNKQPNVNRNNDMTKTTMVNVLPISAYSHPLSAVKAKKNNTKQKNISKKGSKKIKDVRSISNNNPDTGKDCSAAQTTDECKIKSQTHSENSKLETHPEHSEESSKNTAFKCSEKDDKSSKVEDLGSLNKNNDIPNKADSTEKCLNPIKNVNSVSVSEAKKIPSSLDPAVQSNLVLPIKSSKNEPNTLNKAPDLKDSENKSKESKLQNILDPPICENVVDAGNARLELAEEFLAASPTAAFLMSFPLVSGNRADSPTEETPHVKDGTCRLDLQPQTFLEKANNSNQKSKSTNKPPNICNDANKTNSNDNKNHNNKPFNKTVDIKPLNTTTTTNVGSENPFLSLPLPTVISTNCTLSDASFGLDFDCNISKATSSQANCVSSNSLFYKSDPFNSVKNTVYSTSSLSSGHEYNSLGLYPCAVENYSSKNKSDFPNIEENLMKINTSRLTYDIDLGWSHKSLDFVNCTTSSNSLHKDNIFTSTPSTYTSSYNPFNPEFHASLTNASKKDLLTSKSSTFSEAITSFYSQTSNLWSDDVTSIFANGTAPKNMPAKQQHYTDLSQTNSNLKSTVTKQYDAKQMLSTLENNKSHATVTGNQHNISEKYTKKSPSKMHINWMTSETRPSQNHCEQIHTEVKENYKSTYGHINMASRKMGQSENNYFPINMHHFPSQTSHEEPQMWPSTKPAGTTEISIEPPPIHLPTLVGDLALGPHEKKRNDLINRGLYQSDQNCSNFLSVTQLMNRSSDNASTRAHATNIESKSNAKHNLSQIVSDSSRKPMNSRIDSNLQHCYGFNDAKVTNNFDAVNQFSHTKSKTNKLEKNPKLQKNNYSAEALIRGGTCSQKALENSSAKFMLPSQKFGDFGITQDTSVAQVSHYPPLLDYSENSYVGQQYSGTTLYNSTANTIPNSFYSNFMQSGTNLMPSSYTGGPFTGEYIDYNNQSTECNYTNHKYDDIKVRNSINFQQDKSTRRESAKHKLDCTKKETSKKYPTKRSKLNTESEEWGDNTHLLWQNKTASKRHGNMVSEELQFPNFVSNQMPTQYQPDFLNSHFIPSNVQNVGHGTERTPSTFPVASRGNFNLSALFPEITMKVQ